MKWFVKIITLLLIISNVNIIKTNAQSARNLRTSRGSISFRALNTDFKKSTKGAYSDNITNKESRLKRNLISTADYPNINKSNGLALRNAIVKKHGGNIALKYRIIKIMKQSTRVHKFKKPVNKLRKPLI